VTERRVAILGGGMLGVCTALELAARGQRVTLIEGMPEILQGASRWNEGKIHLGFLYAADAGFNTAKRVIPGGLAFVDLVERFVGCSLDRFSTEDDVYLVHRDSVVNADAFAVYANRNAELVRDAARGGSRYLTNVKSARVDRLSASELAAFTPSADIVAAFRVPERSVSTVPIADLLSRAVHAEPNMDVRAGTWIDGVRRRDDGRYDVLACSGRAADLDGFDVVVNALWEGRLAVDATLGIVEKAPWSHRFRAAVFANVPSNQLHGAVVCTGPFGDVNRYADGRVYLSWYDAGLLAEGSAVEPPRTAAALTPERREKVLKETLASLAKFYPGLDEVGANATALDVHGGWVYAIGSGSLADRESLLHRRDRFATTVDRGYISVDTAKYSLAPWLAQQVADVVSPL
jgi:glycine/D-amino acid oxidase-like deaminating enzyme